MTNLVMSILEPRMNSGLTSNLNTKFQTSEALIQMNQGIKKYFE